LTQVIDLSILEGKLVGNILNSIATAGFVFIYVNRDSQIVVSDRRKENIVSYLLDDDIFTLEFGPSYANSYSIIRVNYGRVALSESELFLKLDNITIPTGVKSFKNLILDKTNMVDIDYIRATSVQGDILIFNITATQDTISFDVNNTGVASVDIALSVYGRSVNISDTFEEKVYQTAVDAIGERVLEVNNQLLQTEVYAEELADRVFDNLIKEIPYFKLGIDDTSMELKLEDVITVSHEKLNGKVYVCKVQSLKTEVSDKGYKLDAIMTVLREDI